MKSISKNLTTTNLKELASTVGAGILGFGLGALLVNFIQQYTLWIIFLGLLMHGWGMYRTHHQNDKERYHVNSVSQIKVSEFSWKNLLYWLL
ncbi:MAG: hypothetical protein FIB08_12635 [Candidatus Methanoperedens sp.]|nr:hypothetical protein [Candidatus Methanoperedens sp.]